MTYRTYYYINPVFENRVAKLSSDRTPEQLYAAGIFEEGEGYLERTEETEDCFLSFADEQRYFECMCFDDPVHPTCVIVDIDAAKELWANSLRSKRNELLSITDHEYVRAFGMQKHDLITEIEADKEALRGVTDIDITKVKTLNDLNGIKPAILEIDYESKYSDFD